jgi:ribonuclease HI
MIKIYTDGSCYPNPGGPGGYSYLIEDNFGTQIKNYYGGETSSTNNRMEMRAAISALEYMKNYPRSNIELYTDSQYLKNGITEWIHTWQKRNFKGVKNGDLWAQIYSLMFIHDLIVIWIKGHEGHPQNEKCDELALKGRLEFTL